MYFKASGVIFSIGFEILNSEKDFLIMCNKGFLNLLKLLLIQKFIQATLFSSLLRRILSFVGLSLVTF